MPKSHKPYPPELKRWLVEMVRAGRQPEELAEKFEPTAQSIRNWTVQADGDAGRAPMVSPPRSVRPRLAVGGAAPALYAPPFL